MARCLSEQSGLDKTYWPYAINMSSEIKKFCYHSGFKRSPFEAMYGQKTKLESLKNFDCTAYVHIDKSFRGEKIGLHKKVYSWGHQITAKHIL